MNQRKALRLPTALGNAVALLDCSTNSWKLANDDGVMVCIALQMLSNFEHCSSLLSNFEQCYALLSSTGHITPEEAVAAAVAATVAAAPLRRQSYATKRCEIIKKKHCRLCDGDVDDDVNGGEKHVNELLEKIQCQVQTEKSIDMDIVEYYVA